MNEEYTFEGQRQGEKVIAVVQNHPYVLFWPGLKTIFCFSAAAALILFTSLEFTNVLAFIFVIVGIGFFSRVYFLFSHSLFVISSSRILNIEQSGFWKRRVTETELFNIQDVASTTAGFSRTILKFGDLVIRTAGATAGSEIIIKNIPNPYTVQQLIANTK